MKPRLLALLTVIILALLTNGFALDQTAPSRAAFCKSYGCVLSDRWTGNQFTDYIYALSTNKHATVKFKVLNSSLGRSEYVDYAELKIAGTPALSRPYAVLGLALLYATAGKRVNYDLYDLIQLCGHYYTNENSLLPLPQETVKEVDYWYELKCYNNAGKPSSVTLTIDRWKLQR